MVDKGVISKGTRVRYNGEKEGTATDAVDSACNLKVNWKDGTGSYVGKRDFNKLEYVCQIWSPVVDKAVISKGTRIRYEGEKEGLWKFKDTTYHGSTPKQRPLPMKDALKKWPEARLYCNERDLCWPIAEETKQTITTRDNNDKKVHPK